MYTASQGPFTKGLNGGYTCTWVETETSSLSDSSRLEKNSTIIGLTSILLGTQLNSAISCCCVVGKLHSLTFLATNLPDNPNWAFASRPDNFANFRTNNCNNLQLVSPSCTFEVFISRNGLTDSCGNPCRQDMHVTRNQITQQLTAEVAAW